MSPLASGTLWRHTTEKVCVTVNILGIKQGTTWPGSSLLLECFTMHTWEQVQSYLTSGNGSADSLCHLSCFLSRFFKHSNQCFSLSPFALMPSCTPPENHKYSWQWFYNKAIYLHLCSYVGWYSIHVTRIIPIYKMSIKISMNTYILQCDNITLFMWYFPVYWSVIIISQITLYLDFTPVWVFMFNLSQISPTTFVIEAF